MATFRLIFHMIVLVLTHLYQYSHIKSGELKYVVKKKSAVWD